MLWPDSPCAVLPKERKLLVRCDGVLLGCDRNSSLATSSPEKLLRCFPYDAIEDLGVSSDNLTLCPIFSPYVKGVEGFDKGVGGGRGRAVEGARNPSYSKKSSWAPAVGFSFFIFLSEDEDPCLLENMFVTD